MIPRILTPESMGNPGGEPCSKPAEPADSPAGASVLPRWRQELANGIATSSELLALLGLEPTIAGDPTLAAAAGRQFPLRVPRGFVARMQPGNPHDPLLLQVLPQAAELQPLPGYHHDPLAEEAAVAIPGLLHKYPGRVLLVTTGACAIHCRYCFRRHFPYTDQRPDWQKALEYIRGDATISEVLLSGGDPLVLTDEKLGALGAALAEIPHVRRLRIHTRLPVVLPSRVDEALVDWLTGTRLQPVVVLHANHPQELDQTVAMAVDRLRTAKITVLNQAVLLRGINDRTEILESLSRALFTMGVLPYYLHLLDRVQGAGQFEVGGDTAISLYNSLLRELPGYLVPRFVREVPGVLSKVPISFSGVSE